MRGVPGYVNGDCVVTCDAASVDLCKDARKDAFSGTQACSIQVHTNLRVDVAQYNKVLGA